MSNFTCPVCNGSCTILDVVDFNKSCEETRSKFFKLSGIPIYYVICDDCSFSYAPSMYNWSPQDFKLRVYNENYVLVDPDYLIDRPTDNSKFLNSKFFKHTNQISHLDYGGGNGILSDILRKLNWQSDVFDPYSDKAPSEEKVYNLITAFEVFEHVSDIHQLMTDLQRLISSDGLIIFTTLFSDGKLQVNQRINWWYAAPRNGHISLFSAKSMNTLASNYGFQLKSISSGLHVMWKDSIPSWASNIF